MFEEEDRETGYAVFLAVTLAIVVSLFVIAIAIGNTIGQAGSKKPARPSASMPSMVRIVGLVLFEAGKAEPPADIAMLLAPTVRSARAMPAAKIVVSGYHDASGDVATNEELAKRRALAVRDALTAAGIDARRIELTKPVSTLGSEDADQARRVELTLH